MPKLFTLDFKKSGKTSAQIIDVAAMLLLSAGLFIGGAIWAWGGASKAIDKANNAAIALANEQYSTEQEVYENRENDYSRSETNGWKNSILFNDKGITIISMQQGSGLSFLDFVVSNGKQTKKFNWGSSRYSPPFFKCQDFNGDGEDELFVQLFHGGSSGYYSEEIHLLNASTLKELKIEDNTEVKVEKLDKSTNIKLKNGNAFYNLPKVSDGVTNNIYFLSYKLRGNKLMSVESEIQTINDKISVYIQKEYSFNKTGIIVSKAKLVKVTDGSGVPMISQEE